MIKIDIRIISVLISAGVALFIAILNHFVITPIKENRARKREKLKNLYAPLYSLVMTRVNLIKPQIVTSGRYMLGGLSDSTWLNKEYMHKFFLEKAGYASNDMINAWISYSSAINPSQDITKRFVFQLVKEYNQLKKELRLPYNKKELETGIPDILKGVKITE
jgi:hypothetical protein